MIVYWTHIAIADLYFMSGKKSYQFFLNNYLLGIAAESERTLLTFLFARPTFEVILETVDIRSNFLSDPTEVIWFFLSSTIPVSGVEEKTSSCREDSSFSIHDKK